MLMTVLLVGSFSCESPLDVVEETTAEKGPKKDKGNDCDCKGGMTSLDLEYLGAETDAVVKIYKDKIESKKILAVFTNVNPGDILSFEGVGKDNKMGAKIRITVNDDKKNYTEIHTSCSQDISIGMAFGDYVVRAGTSKDGGDLCETSEQDCGECEKGITSLDLEFLGTETNATIKVYKDKVENKKLLATFTNVNAGDLLSFTGTGKDGKMGAKIRITINDSKDYTEIHTSCSQDIYAGMTFDNKYLIKSGISSKGGPLCPMPEPPGEVECGECKKGITYLELQYNGESGADITVYNKKGKVVDFWTNVSNGDLLAFSGSKDDGKFDGSEIKITDSDGDTYIHVSCSQDIYAGMVFGNYTVISGMSKEGGPLCPMPDPPGDGDCGECKKGITFLALEYLGDPVSNVSVYDKSGVVASWDNVVTGQLLEFNGSKDDGKFDGAEITISNGINDTPIHVSCSQDIFAGMVFGDYLVKAGMSKEGGPLCEIEYCVMTSTDLIAGQNTVVGSIEVTEEGEDYMIKYSVTDGWCITETHLDVEWTAQDFPTNNGNPAPGQFEYKNDHDCVTEYTYTVPKSEGIYIAAHAVVNCISDPFEALESSLPDVVNACTTEKGVSAVDSYFNLTISDTSLAGDYDAWCVDFESSLQVECFEAEVYLNYDELPDGKFVHKDKFDLVNWILNEDYVGKTSNQGDPFTFSDVQIAIWEIIEERNCTDSTCSYVGEFNVDRIDEIIAEAEANGDGFVPDCGELVAIVLVPTSDLQSVVIGIPLECPEECEETAWGNGCPFPGNNWATYFQYTHN